MENLAEFNLFTEELVIIKFNLIIYINIFNNNKFNRFLCYVVR